MVSNILNYVKNNWKQFTWGLAPLAIIAIVFAFPLKTVPVYTTETYYETEIVSQPYTINESYTRVEPYTMTESRTETVYDSYVSGSWSHTFEVDKPDATITVEFDGYSYHPQYIVFRPQDGEPAYRFWPYDYWGSQTRATIKVSYPEEVLKYKTITGYRDVTKYREVSTEVLKKRTATENIKMSIWGYLFR